jgi:flavin-dependent dehydrogenase
MPPVTKHDAVVVGARVAGAATAMLLARAGCDVLVLDRSRYGTDTLSTHALMRPGVLQLSRWGVLDRIVAAGTPPVRRTGLQFGDRTVDLAVKDAEGVSALYAPRRTLLDAVLVDAAREAGAQFRYATSVVDVVRDRGGRLVAVVGHDVNGHTFEARGQVHDRADGVRSTIARLVGARVTRTGAAAAAVVYGYFDLDHEGYDWFYGPGVTAGAIPTNEGCTLVFAAASPERMRQETVTDIEAGFRRVLAAAAPHFAPRLEGRSPVERYRRFPGIPGHMRKPFGDGWALVGDAGYHRDPLTAHGITDALRDAELLARALVHGGHTTPATTQALAEYEWTRDLVSQQLFDVAERIASLVWTLDEVSQLITDLNDAMVPETDLLTGSSHPTSREAVA